MAEWQVWRHKTNHEIRYYVEAQEGELVLYTESVGGGEWDDRVRIKGVKNIWFDKEDWPPHQAPEAGMWPYDGFVRLYEPEAA